MNKFVGRCIKFQGYTIQRIPWFNLFERKNKLLGYVKTEKLNLWGLILLRCLWTNLTFDSQVVFSIFRYRLTWEILCFVSKWPQPIMIQCICFIIVYHNYMRASTSNNFQTQNIICKTQMIFILQSSKIYYSFE